MKPIVLREEEPPNDTTVVIRGGAMTSDTIIRTATDAYEELGIYAVSVFLALDQELSMLCSAEPFLSRYGSVRLSTVGRLREGGFALIPTLGRPHYDIVLPDLTPNTLQRLDAVFDAPVPNPGSKP